MGRLLILVGGRLLMLVGRWDVGELNRIVFLIFMTS